MKKINLSIIVSTLLVTNIYAKINNVNMIISSATKSEQSIKDITSNVEVITSQEIEAKNITTVNEALKLIPGLDYNANGGLGQTTSIYLRGMSSKRVLVLIDGIRYNDITGLSGAPFSDLIIPNIKQIEIIKGAQSGIWGADASAGVINIITKNPKMGFSGNINIKIGSFKTKNFDGNIAYKTNKYYLSLSTKKIKTDGFTAQATNGQNINDFEKDGYESRSTTIKSGFNINETNKIDLSHNIISSKNEYDGFNAPNSTIEISKNKHKFTSINFNHIDSFNIVDIYAKHSSLLRKYPNGFTKKYTGNVNEYGIKSKIAYNKKDFFVWGVDYKNFEHKDDINKKYNNKALFLTNSNNFSGQIGGDTIFTQSLRKDIYNKFDNKITGKLGLKHNHGVLKGFSSSINYGTAYNVPTLYNLYSAFGSEDINPEYTKSYDITLAYKQFQVSYFNTKINNMIGFDNATFKYNNLDGTSKIKGYEISFKKAISKTLLTLNYTKLNAKDSDNKDLIRQSKQTFKYGLDYFGIKKLHLNIHGSYIGERFDDSAKTKQTGKYTVTNFNANYKINKKTSIYVKIDNIANKYYQTVYGYATSPRAYYAGVKVKF